MESLEIEIQWFIQLTAAVVLALPTAYNREAHSTTVGLRTFPLVAMGACAFVIIGHVFIGPDSPDAMARIMQGLLTGIGFVGGGAILKNENNVKGTASAASIWITGALGAACGFQIWTLAILLSVLNFAIVYFLSKVKKQVETTPEQ